jgi:hypothetical protein
MSGWVKRVVAPKRERTSQNSTPTGKDAEVKSSQDAQAVPTPDAPYAAALTVLANEQAAGQLDKDLADAAAKSLGQAYRERHPVNSSGADEERIRTAVRAESAAYRIREELVGSGQHGAKDNDLSSNLNAAVSDLLQCLTAVRKHSDSANKRNSGQPILDQRLPSGWERAVIDSVARIQAISSRIGELAQAHAKAVKDHEATRH